MGVRNQPLVPGSLGGSLKMLPFGGAPGPGLGSRRPQSHRRLLLDEDNALRLCSPCEGFVSEHLNLFRRRHPMPLKWLEMLQTRYFFLVDPPVVGIALTVLARRCVSQCHVHGRLGRNVDPRVTQREPVSCFGSALRAAVIATSFLGSGSVLCPPPATAWAPVISQVRCVPGCGADAGVSWQSDRRVDLLFYCEIFLEADPSLP